MQRITPFLWYDLQAEEAANFYVSIFKNSRITDVARYSDTVADAIGIPKGTVMTVGFELDGQKFLALNGGPHFKFTEAISFMIQCDTQEEIDHYWNSLTAGGEESQCGWLKDKFGLSWQVAPTKLGQMMQDKDPQKVARVSQALMGMRKLDLHQLECAFEGK